MILKIGQLPQIPGAMPGPFLSADFPLSERTRPHVLALRDISFAKGLGAVVKQSLWPAIEMTNPCDKSDREQYTATEQTWTFIVALPLNSVHGLESKSRVSV